MQFKQKYTKHFLLQMYNKYNVCYIGNVVKFGACFGYDSRLWQGQLLQIKTTVS